MILKIFHLLNSLEVDPIEKQQKFSTPKKFAILREMVAITYQEMRRGKWL